MLFRSGLATQMVATTFLLNFLLISFLIYWAATAHGMILPGVIYGVILLVIWSRGYRTKKRVAQLVEAAGQRIGLNRVDPKKGNRPPAKSTHQQDAEVTPSNTSAVSPQMGSEVSPQISPESPVSPQG